jgi:2-polyprenyl-3-methyl-5-hydroxy-6-metoxy-1,4-benzoquinol methylase
MERGYQLDFARNNPGVFDREGRGRKAVTMVAVLSDFLVQPLAGLRLLDVGGSAGIIDAVLAEHFADVVSLDIDAPAVTHAAASFQAPNLHFIVGDAQRLAFPESSFDVVVCSHVYEHVPDANVLMREVHRVLKPGGVCYFAAGNRLAWNEPHYNLPLLSVVPRWLAHRYIRWMGKATHYHEQHQSLPGLRRLVRDFECRDYTRRIAADPARYAASYLLPPGSLKTRLALAVLRFAPWLCPSFIWLLRKPVAA